MFYQKEEWGKWKKKMALWALDFFCQVGFAGVSWKIASLFSFLVRTLIELKVLWLAMLLANNLKGWKIFKPQPQIIHNYIVYCLELNQYWKCLTYAYVLLTPHQQQQSINSHSKWTKKQTKKNQPNSTMITQVDFFVYFLGKLKTP